MSDETSRTINTYDHYAAHYAAQLGSVPLEAEQDRFAALLPDGAWVADVGAGPGRYALGLAARGLNVIPLDLSLGLLRAGAAFGVRRRVQANMLRLPFGTGAVDGVWACASLPHLSRNRMPEALRELRRIVRRGGAAYIAVKLGEGARWVPVEGAGSRFFTYYQPDELDDLLAAAGWRIVHAHVNRDGTRPNLRWLNRYCRAV